MQKLDAAQLQLSCEWSENFLCNAPALVHVEGVFIRMFTCLECLELLKNVSSERVAATRIVTRADGAPTCKCNRTLWAQMAEAEAAGG